MCCCPLDERLKKVVKYMQKTWITSSNQPSASWSTFTKSAQTYDAGGHPKLNRHVAHMFKSCKPYGEPMNASVLKVLVGFMLVYMHCMTKFV